MRFVAMQIPPLLNAHHNLYLTVSYWKVETWKLTSYQKIHSRLQSIPITDLGDIDTVCLYIESAIYLLGTIVSTHQHLKARVPQRRRLQVQVR